MMKKSIYWHDLEKDIESQLFAALSTTLRNISFEMVVCADRNTVMANIYPSPNSEDNLNILVNVLSKDSKIIKSINSKYLHYKKSQICEGRFVFLSFSHEYNVTL